MKFVLMFCLLFVCSGVFVIGQTNGTIPAKLFDIRMDLDKTILDDSRDLVMVIKFESFGRVPTHVDLDYSVYDEEGEKVYTLLENITVQVEEIRRVHFENMSLEPGKYLFVLQTIYNIDVYDEFKQEFVIEEEGFWDWLFEWLGF